MRVHEAFPRVLGVLTLVAAGAALLSAQTPAGNLGQPVALIVSSLGGEVFPAGQDTGFAAASGTIVFPGDRLRAGTGGTTLMFCPGKSEYALSSGSQIEFTSEEIRTISGELTLTGSTSVCSLPPLPRGAPAGRFHNGASLSRDLLQDEPSPSDFDTRLAARPAPIWKPSWPRSTALSRPTPTNSTPGWLARRCSTDTGCRSTPAMSTAPSSRNGPTRPGRVHGCLSMTKPWLKTSSVKPQWGARPLRGARVTPYSWAFPTIKTRGSSPCGSLTRTRSCFVSTCLASAAGLCRKKMFSSWSMSRRRRPPCGWLSMLCSRRAPDRTIPSSSSSPAMGPSTPRPAKVSLSPTTAIPKTSPPPASRWPTCKSLFGQSYRRSGGCRSTSTFATPAR